MKIVDARDYNSVDKDYIGVPQPMQIYHSVEELRMNEQNTVIYFQDKLLDFLLEFFKSNLDTYQYSFKDVNAWINTWEEHIIDAWTRDGEPIYATRNGKLIPADGCFIKLYMGRVMRGHIFVVTSSGIWGLNGKRGSEITAGVAPALRNSITWNRKLLRETKTKAKMKRLKKFTEGKVLLKEDISFVGKLLNPLSPHYLKQYGAGTEAYSNAASIIGGRDLDVILNTPRVTELIMKELKILMPELIQAIKKKNDPDTVADMLNRIAEWAITSDSTTVEDKLKSVQAIVSSGYGEENIVLDNKIPLLPEVGAAPMLKPYDDNTSTGSHEIVPQEISNEELTKEEEKTLKEETGTLDDYIFEDTEKPKPENM